MMELISSIFEFGFDVIGFVFTAIIALIAGFSAWIKGRNSYFWGIVTFFYPWLIIIVFLLPRKIPKFKSYLKDEAAFKDKNPVIASIMALSAIVAKADGHVSKEEVNLIKQFITTNFRISSSELATYQLAFDYGKDHSQEYEEFVRVIKLYHNNRRFILSVSYLLLGIGLKGTNLNSNEETMIKKIVIELGLSEYEYHSLKNYFANGGFRDASYASYGSQYNYGQRNYNQRSFGINGASQEDLLEKNAKILGVDKNATMSEVKKAYRKLVKEYHPDKMIADGMPDDYMKYANDRIAKINEAYDFIKRYKEDRVSNETISY